MRDLTFVVFLMLFSFQVFGEMGQSCQCAELVCDPCMQEQGVTFYSEKCGAQGARIKSCARPTCVPKDPAPVGCDYSRAGISEPIIRGQMPSRKIASHSTDQPMASSPGKKAMQRKLAEFKKEARGPRVGYVHTVIGSASLKLSDGTKRKVVKGIEVHEKDEVQTSLRGHVKIEFDDGNIANVKPNSKLRLEHYEMGESKKAILNLIKGKVRSKVKVRYNGETSYFRVKTKSAVAGVRGTDFVVEHEEKDRVVTKVTTFKGSVAFEGSDTDSGVEISKGQQASFIVASASDSEVFTDEEISDFVAKGYMTPVYSLSEAELQQLKRLTEVGQPIKRSVASTRASKSSESVCNAPPGDVNQCMWKCQNNPKGEKRCRTDLPQVNCLRKRCDANGNWSDESRLPASFYERCEPNGFRVGPCDY